MQVTDDHIEVLCQGSPYPWCRQEVELILQLYRRKVSLRDIAEKIGMSRSAVERVLRVMQVPLRKQGKQPSFNPVQEATVLLLLAHGRSQRAVATLMKCSPGAVFNLVRKSRNQ